ncbi:maleylpyruvate isomerase N-terminal domain-containing protein [Nocardiopsis suaedae]|uniref:Maleylpyruvate isomerase N-terminal domain-containing protein n=1 Tax=Nocardiopsis suaedae TaxID=3018444 RepID=A0ABT4TJS1_9ACTN|nr:maleylpyruvate isomerase N-terminal domain-containing protein [Nocardiopsis suaedae]MDA2804915.1 maleylpyruvate isomerase N-terminal domain-containing protein [Nocardiopsis suaedae]
MPGTTADSPGSPASPGPVTADDLDRAVRLAVDALHGAPADGWGRNAGPVDWDCWETVEHLSDDLFAYAVQLGPRNPPVEGEVPITYASRRPGGPETTIRVGREAGAAGLLQALEASGALLAAMVRTASPRTRAYHPFGVSDPEGFAAMGVVETLVHTHDLAQGLGLEWEPPPDLCARVLARLFPDVPVPGDGTESGPWGTLLWATGRADLPGRPRRTGWRWDGTPRP